MLSSGLKNTTTYSGIVDEEKDDIDKLVWILKHSTQNVFFGGTDGTHSMHSNSTPDTCHYVLARLEALGLLVSVITQSTDGLHQKAGSKKVHELYRLIDEGVVVAGRLFHEENVNETAVTAAMKDISCADTLIIGGTLLEGYPTSELLDCFQGRNFIVINKICNPVDHRATMIIRADISDVLEEIAWKMMKNTWDK